MVIQKFLNLQKPIFLMTKMNFTIFLFFNKCPNIPILWLTSPHPFFSARHLKLCLSVFFSWLYMASLFRLCYYECPYVRVSFASLNFNPKTSLFHPTSCGISCRFMTACQSTCGMLQTWSISKSSQRVFLYHHFYFLHPQCLLNCPQLQSAPSFQLEPLLLEGYHGYRRK